MWARFQVFRTGRFLGCMHVNSLRGENRRGLANSIRNSYSLFRDYWIIVLWNLFYHITWWEPSIKFFFMWVEVYLWTRNLERHPKLKIPSRSEERSAEMCITVMLKRNHKKKNHKKIWIWIQRTAWTLHVTFHLIADGLFQSRPNRWIDHS